ncbi:BatD family protein [Lysobacter sp. GX 14042]|uniref:BatD family protein n=1 Tax=Lysobacter sp. GX 14042 TaxID=2907155 RepID=UPI001F306803|nr:BatD family protein [Lysobacter sp. GX 14042]MCE7033460.1 BatD family protein [Lysobacter sp. GX 14042]
MRAAPQALQALLVLLVLASGLAHAEAPRAWVDREQIVLGETVTLNIQAEGATPPDYEPLRADFEISGLTSRSELVLADGGQATRTLFAAALRPQRAGTLILPSLQVGAERTNPVTLRVSPAPAPTPAGAGADVFLESSADDPEPYAQQAVGWVVRLYSAVPLVSGRLDQAAPEGASLRQVGDDAQYTRSIAGRHYNVIERRYLLIPERSGALEVPGALFEGRGARGFFDDVLGRGGTLSAHARVQRLQVLPVPEGAPQPWLPLHSLELSYRALPQELHAGAAATVTVEMVADGAGSAQAPELQLPPIPGVRVFPEPAEVDQRVVDGRPRVTVRRQFSLVPSAAGEVELPALEMQWWDVASDRARTARLEPARLTVRPGAGVPGAAAAPGPGVRSPGTGPATGDGGSAAGPAWPANRGWILATAGFAGLWLLTLVWALQHRAAGGRIDAGNPAPAATAAPADPAALRRALDTGDLGDVADALCAQARPPAADVDGLRARLADPAQVAAVDALQRARWAGGDGPTARRQLREAFAKGPRWHEHPEESAQLLPPLYPERTATNGTR